MVTLALTVLVLLGFDDATWAKRTNLAIWGLFVIDYAIRLTLSSDRRRFVRSAWLDLIAILPLDFLRAARALRVARLARLVRSVSVLWRITARVRGVLQTNGLATVLAFSCLLIGVGGLTIWAVEPDMGSLTDGLWWSVVTTTTVGYGDLSPTTSIGRVVAVVLMVVGIGTIGMITGSIATFFIKDSEFEVPEHVQILRDELARWPALTAAERRRLALLLKDLAEDGEPNSVGTRAELPGGVQGAEPRLSSGGQSGGPT